MSATISGQVTAKEAVKLALEYVRDLYANSGSQIVDLCLEEIQPSEDGEWWNITVGFYRASDPDITAAAYVVTTPSSAKFRQYKIVPVHRQTGEIRGISIRELWVP